jgi:hypothetical protein
VNGQVPFELAAQAGRESFLRARRAGCTLEEHVVLEAVVSLTALESKLTVEVAVAVVAERASVHPKNASRALGRLRDLGVVDYVPGRGRGHISRVGLPSPEKAEPDRRLFKSDGEGQTTQKDGHPSVPKREPSPGGPAKPSKTNGIESAPRTTTAAGRGFELPDDTSLAARVLELFNRRAGTSYAIADWGEQVLERVNERPDWTLEDWRDVIRRAFAVAWWEKKLPFGEAPTPEVIFSSARQVDSTLNVPDRLVEQAEQAGNA